MSHHILSVISLMLIILLDKCHVYESANILILQELPTPSHHLWFRSVTTELAKRGHNVTIVSPGIDTIQVPNVHQIHMEKVYKHLFNSSDFEYNLIEIGALNAFVQVLPNLMWALKACEGFISSKGWKQLQNYPEDAKFDLVIHDFPASTCLLSFLTKFNYPPLIGMTAFSDPSVIVSMIQTALVPSISTHFLFKESKFSSFFDRFQNYVLHSIMQIMREMYVNPSMDEMVKKSFNGQYDFLPMKELQKQATLVLINYNEIIDGMAQLPPNAIGVGGLHIQEPKKLSMDLLDIVDNATNGLILFSLGTNVKSETLGNKTITEILRAFERLSSYRFLWKIDLTDISVNIPTNVYIRKWVAQNDILGHTNTKLFITHGGLLSIQESIYHSVPMLGIPILIDQFMNIDRCVEKGIAGRMNVKTLNADNLFANLNEMLSNPMFRENMKLISKAFRDQKELPLDRAVWWIEWALRNPKSYIINHGKDLNYFQIQSIDVISFLTVITMMIVYTVIILLRKIFVCIFIRKKTIDANKNKKD